MGRGAAVVLVVVLALLSSGIGPAAAGPLYCTGTAMPPPPPADEEVVPGTTVPAPLPWPDPPVGGPSLQGCDDRLPPGAAVPPDVQAAAWIIGDLDTGAVLAARAPHARHRPASALKVLTALVVLDRLDPDTVVAGTADDAQVGGSRAGIGPGGRYTVRQLLAGLLLNSGNDAANALSRALGGAAATTAAMGAKAGELGALDTRAATPSGLDGPGMASSAYDLALLFRVAMRDPLFVSTVATRTVQFPGFGTQPGFELTNSSRLLARYPGALGAKTGFTDASRHTLVGAAARGGRRLVVAVVRSEQQPQPVWEQAAALLDLGFALPAGSAPVGTLVDAAPTPGPDGAATADTGNPPEPPVGLPVLMIVAVGASVIAVALLQRVRMR